MRLFSYLYTIYHYPSTAKADKVKIESLLKSGLGQLINNVPTSGVHRVKRKDKVVQYSPTRRAGIVQRDIADLMEVYGAQSKEIMKRNRELIQEEFTIIYKMIIQTMQDYTQSASENVFYSYVINVPSIKDTTTVDKATFNNFLLGMNIQTTQKMINLLSNLNTTDMIPSRRLHISAEAPLHDNIKHIINTKLLKGEQKQYLIENYILSYEFNYFQSLFSEANPKVELTAFRRFYTQLLTGITIVKEHYTKNDYKMLRKVLDEPKGPSVLFFLLCDNELMVGVVFSEMVKLINASGFVFKSQICSHVSDVLFKRATRMKTYPKIDPILLSFYPDYETKGLREFELELTYKAGLGIELVENTLLRLDAFQSRIITQDGLTQTEITFSDKYKNVLTQIGMDTIKLPMICKPDVWGPEQVGGYLTPEMKYFVNNKESVIHNSPYSKFASVAHDMQFDTVNYLNSQRFVINRAILERLIKE